MLTCHLSGSQQPCYTKGNEPLGVATGSVPGWQLLQQNPTQLALVSTLNGSDQHCTGEHMLILASIKSKSGPKSTRLIAQSELMASEVIKIPFNLAPIYHTAAFILFVPG
ncbi:hypothetical protein HispidOSU_014086 [Sigmodon hispidus]